MKHSHPIDASQQKAKDARELQARLYREIGISAVAAALCSSTKPDSSKQPALHPLAAKFRHEDELAA